MITENSAVLRGGKSYRDPNTKKTREDKERKDGRHSGGLASLQGCRGPTWQSARKPIKPKARRCRQGKAAPAAVRIQHEVERLRAISPSIGGRIVKYKHKKKKRRPRFESLDERRLAETVVVERKQKKT